MLNLCWEFITKGSQWYSNRETVKKKLHKGNNKIFGLTPFHEILRVGDAAELSERHLRLCRKFQLDFTRLCSSFLCPAL